jgi:hypothetical protein
LNISSLPSERKLRLSFSARFIPNEILIVRKETLNYDSANGGSTAIVQPGIEFDLEQLAACTPDTFCRPSQIQNRSRQKAP